MFGRRTAWLLFPLLVLAIGLGTPRASELRFEPQSATDRVVVAMWEPQAARVATETGAPFVARDFPLPAGLTVDLELQPFSVTSDRTRFVVGQKGMADRPLDFDPSSLMLFRGRVAGRSDSSVFLALSDSISTGHIEVLGRRYGISSRASDGERLEAGRVTIFAATAAAGAKPPSVPLCGVEPTTGAELRNIEVGGLPAVSKGAQHLEIAVETDYEFFRLFGDTDAAAIYLVALYAQVSDIYLRDVDTWVELTFARLWDDPDDRFNSADPLPEFRGHWNQYMGSVGRDVAQLLSGRRDYPFGGQGYLSVLCGGNAYSVVGYALGFFPDPSTPSPYNYDIAVTAHELGHNSGTGHTQDNGLDTCHLTTGSPQRGSIMSYCGQTWSGGNANRDGRFHTTIQANMRSHIFTRSCVVDDCNRNGVADADDIQSATSTDADGNGTPDECEDCNGNLVLDDQDLSEGGSLDLNGNGVPDECDPDCDGDGVPDDKEIADGAEADLHGDGIPDACQTDCDQSGVYDYDQIQLDMTLDVDRNAILDACQDCDTDGTPDLTELAGAHSVWIASGLGPSSPKRFLPTTGVLTRVAQSGPASSIQEGRDLLATAGGHFLVSSVADHTVREFDAAGNFVRVAVASNAGGLDGPTGLLLGPADTLLVASSNTDEVLAYDLATAAPLGALVAAGSGGLDAPFGMTHGPAGDLYVTSDAGEVLRYDMADGSFLGAFVSSASNGGLSQPRGLVFKADGNLLVSSYGTDEVLEYEGATGAPLGKWAQVGTATRLTQTSPWGIRIGPNGNVFVIRTGEEYGSGATGHHDPNTANLHLTDAQIYEYDVRDGNFLRAHVTGHDHELLFPTGFDFIPGWDVDCNFNLIQDDCDVATGTSEDVDSNGVPDECEIDCNGNGTLDRLDIIPFGSSRDCNANLTPDSCDLSTGASSDCTGNGIPDECEADCNRNGTADSCDLLSGSSTDCNANGEPDDCEALVDFESAPPGWSVGAAGDSATGGIWVRGNPNGSAAQTEYDHTAGDGRNCYVTGQGPIGGADDLADVDGGSTTLVSAEIDLSANPDPHIGYWRWFSNDRGSNPSEDVFRVEISADGVSGWVNVESVGPAGAEASGGWIYHSFRVLDFVAATSAVRIRFVAEDLGGDSVVEAAIDDLVVQPFCCQGAASCADGLTCTLESCEISGQCDSAIAPGTCSIAEACYAASEINPADDCEACDPSNPTAWSPSLPVEVEDLVVAAGPTVVAWSPQAGAVYDIVGGSLAGIVADGGVSSALCLADGVTGASWEDSRADPLPGQGDYYLVRSEKSCGSAGYGLASGGTPRLPTSDCP